MYLQEIGREGMDWINLAQDKDKWLYQLFYFHLKINVGLHTIIIILSFAAASINITFLAKTQHRKQKRPTHFMPNK